MTKITKFKVGDLVRFDVSHALGIVTRVKKAEHFNVDGLDTDEVYDVMVYWNDHEEFWCLDFVLTLLSRASG